MATRSLAVCQKGSLPGARSASGVASAAVLTFRINPKTYSAIQLMVLRKTKLLDFNGQGRFGLYRTNATVLLRVIDQVNLQRAAKEPRLHDLPGLRSRGYPGER